jgi:hypothetical protein
VWPGRSDAVAVAAAAGRPQQDASYAARTVRRRPPTLRRCASHAAPAMCLCVCRQGRRGGSLLRDEDFPSLPAAAPPPPALPPPAPAPQQGSFASVAGRAPTQTKKKGKKVLLHFG